MGLYHEPLEIIAHGIFTIISTIAHDGVLAGKCRNFPGQLRVDPWAITTNLDLGRLLSTPWDTE